MFITCMRESSAGCPEEDYPYFVNIRGGLLKAGSPVRAMHLIEILAGRGAA